MIETPTLNEGERYIGATVDVVGTLTHIILLPGSTKDTWKKSIAWAESLGGDLPTRVEQAMLNATAKDAFEENWYWSNETHNSDAGYAWCQYFDYGSQYSTPKDYELRARAVRRLIIQ